MNLRTARGKCDGDVPESWLSAEAGSGTLCCADTGSWLSAEAGSGTLCCADTG